MRKLFLGFLLFIVPTYSFAQCNGIFPAGSVCMNSQGISAPPAATSGASFIIPLTNDEAVTVAPGMAVYVSGNNTFKKAIATAYSTSGVIGLVRASVTAGSVGVVENGGVLTLTTTQWDAVTGGSGGLVANTLYFLDPSTAGNITDTPPSIAGQSITLIGRALSTTKMLITLGQPILL